METKSFSGISKRFFWILVMLSIFIVGAMLGAGLLTKPKTQTEGLHTKCRKAGHVQPFV
jgi:uncharacterized membrane protein